MPGRGVAGSLVGHVLLLGAIVPLSRMPEPAAQLTLPQIQIMWYGPATDVTPLPAAKPKPVPHPAAKAEQPVVARAYNPKTTVIFKPPRPTNTHQLLIEPQAPPTPPSFLAALANIITWATAAPVQPPIAVNPAGLVARKSQSGATAAMTAPQIANAISPARPLDIVTNRNAPPIPLTSGAVRAARPPQQPSSAAAPTVAYAANRLVALSLAPGKALPPPGNAYAPISIGPRVSKIASRAAPEIAADAGPGAGMARATNGATPGPAGLLIFHEASGPAPPPAPRAPSPTPKIANSSAIPRPFIPLRARSGAGSGIMPHDLAHRILGMRPIHTLLMDMPNLTSASGSWKLDFAEFPGEKIPLGGDIIPPLPVRKVDPEYPPALIQEGIQGEVVLYAEIGTNGGVSHIRVVQSLDPVLDRNAEIAFSKWKFEPALADNVPIDLEVLVHIPFNFQSTQ